MQTVLSCSICFLSLPLLRPSLLLTFDQCWHLILRSSNVKSQLFRSMFFQQVWDNLAQSFETWGIVEKSVGIA